MHRMKLIVRALFIPAVVMLFTGLTVQVNAANYYWYGDSYSGAGNNNWSTASNWSTSPLAYAGYVATSVPGSADAVFFQNNGSTVILTAAVTVTSMTLSSGVNIGMTANGTLTVSGATTLGASSSIDFDGSASPVLVLNGSVSFAGGTASDPTQIHSSVAAQAQGVRVVHLGSASTLSMGDLRGTFFGDGVNVWIKRNTGLLQTPVRFNDDITLDAEFNPGSNNVWLGVKADILRSGYQNQNQKFITFTSQHTAAGMVIKDIAYWQDGSGNYVPGAGYFNWEVGTSKIAAIRVEVEYAEYDGSWSDDVDEPFRGVGVRAVNLEHPDNGATNKYEFYWVVQPFGLLQDNGPGFPSNTSTPNKICYEVEFHPGYIQGSPKNVYSARYSNNWEEVLTAGGGLWYADGSTSTSTQSAGRVFVPQCSAYGFGDITIGVGTDPVPVELVSFSARYLDGMVRLNWNTATEINNFGFAIERSRDGESWEDVGFVPGYGNSSSPKSYVYEDVLGGDMLRIPQLAYRLRQMDRDGTTDYSNIVFVSMGELPTSAELYAAYPNPFNPTTTISFAIKNAASVTLKVYNTFGQEIATLLANSAMDAGLHTVPFSGDQLPSGVYMAVLEADGVLQHQKLVLNK